MRLVVVSHKVCWPCSSASTGYATDGGFAFQMRALSELFDATTLVVPCNPSATPNGEIPIDGHNMSIVPITVPVGQDFTRKLKLPFWFARNVGALAREIRRADAVHTPIPGDIGTLGLLTALVFRKRLFVRYCGNWLKPRTMAQRFWKRLLEICAGQTNVVLATGGSCQTPSARNPHIRWIFSTSLSERELDYCARLRRNPPQVRPRLIIACRQDRAKGAGIVIQSLPALIEQFPDIQFDVVGDGIALAEFKALASDLGVTDRVVFHGRVNHERVVALLQKADLFCFPTAASEGFPKAVLEAMACGLPVISTRVSVLPRLMESGAGVLVDEASPAEVVRAVRWCFADSSRYSAMSAASIRTARAYSLEQWRDTVGDLLSPGWGALRNHA